MVRKGAPFLFLLAVLYVVGLMACRPKVAETDLESKALAIHDRILSVDTHCDTASRLLGSTWDIGVRHEPGQPGSGKIDLPRMAEGGLDAEFFAVFVG